MSVGLTQLRLYRDVVYSRPKVGRTHAELTLDIRRPSGAGVHPLVLFVTGCGFVIATNPPTLTSAALSPSTGTCREHRVPDGRGRSDVQRQRRRW
jgi:hypothetical protein